MTAPTGFLQVDVDGLWAVRACYGRSEAGTFARDPCWTEGLVRLDETFQRVGVPASFFIVGRDLELDSKREAAKGLLRCGYELANHSYTHRLGLTMEPTGRIMDEMKKTDQALRDLGASPVGFRSPGYDLDARVLRCVRMMNYLYDASMLPTYLGPLMRVADAVLAERWQPGKRQFGRFVYGRAPREPYHPVRYKIRKRADENNGAGVLEIPVGTTPVLHMPLTAATLFTKSRRELGELFGRLAKKQRPTLLLLHAIDGVDCRQPIVFDTRRPRLGGFSLTGEQKQKRLVRIVEEFARHFEVELACDFAGRLRPES